MRHPTTLERGILEELEAEPRRCGFAPCSSSLDGRRADAAYCGPPCRTDAHHAAAISAAFWRQIGRIRPRTRPARRNGP